MNQSLWDLKLDESGVTCCYAMIMNQSLWDLKPQIPQNIHRDYLPIMNQSLWDLKPFPAENIGVG